MTSAGSPSRYVPDIFDVDHAQDALVETRDEVAGDARLLVRAAHARVVGREQVATARELGSAAHRELHQLVDGAQGDGIDVCQVVPEPMVSLA